MIEHLDLLGLEVKELEWYQMVIRAIVVFLIALAFIRIAGMRSFGFRSPFDIVLSITLGAVLSRCITGHYPFFPCLAAATTLAFFHRIIAWFSYKNTIINKLTEGDPVLLYKDGKKIEKNLEEFNISESDITKALHQQNLGDYKKVASIWLETDGTISIVKKDES